MPPLSPHRRARRRSRRVVILVCVVIVAALLVGGATQIGRQSTSYYASVNRSFAAQATSVIQESNTTGATLRQLMRTMPAQDGGALQAQLDTVVARADQESAVAASLSAPSTPGGVQGAFASVLNQRDQAARRVRSALDGLLGLHQLPVAGGPGADATLAAAPAAGSPTQATNLITTAGTLLAQADQSYASLRRTLPRLDGHARLPASRWVTDAAVWQAGPLAAQLALVQSALPVTHRLVLSVVQVTPSALPPASGAATPGLSILSPTKSVQVEVVLTNLGTADEPHASVQFQLTPQPTGAAVTITKTSPLAAAGSVSLSPVSFKVKPGTSYQLTVAVVLPAGQTDTTGASLTQVLQIAPSS